MDLEMDLKLILIQLLKNNYNIELDDSTNLKKVLIVYFRTANKHISAHPRTVHISEELQRKLSSNLFSSDDLQNFNIIKTDFERGNDVNKYLSIRINNPNFNDTLFNQFGIRHLHLNTTLADNEFVTRSGNHVLFMTDKDNVYFIDIREHLRGSEYADTSILKIVKNNWENLLLKMDNVIALDSSFNNGQPLTSEDRWELTNGYSNNPVINSPIEIDGQFYFSSRLGSNIDGTGNIDDIQSIDVLRYLNELHFILTANKETIYNIFLDNHIEVNPQITFKLVFKDNIIKLCEAESKTQLIGISIMQKLNFLLFNIFY